MAVLKYRKSDGSGYAVLTAVAGGSSVTDIQISGNNLQLVNGTTPVGTGVTLTELGDHVQESINGSIITDDAGGTPQTGGGDIITD